MGERGDGAEPRNHNVIIRFPTLAAARAWWESGAYQEIVPIRLQHAGRGRDVPAGLGAGCGGVGSRTLPAHAVKNKAEADYARGDAFAKRRDLVRQRAEFVTG